MLTTTQIEAKLNNIDNKIKGIILRLDNQDITVSGKSTLADLNRMRTELELLIKDQATVLNNLETKLSKVKLPEETRYYLQEGEVKDFQANFNSLKAMMTSFKKMFESLTAYVSNLKTLN